MRTEDGKNISSQNGTKHGCCSEKDLILQNETIEDFKALEAIWMTSYKPRDEHQMVEQLTRADWFFQRAERAFAHVEGEPIESGFAADWSEEQEKKLLRIQRYHTARNDVLIKATRVVRPPNWSLSRALTRSLMVRSLYRSSCALVKPAVSTDLAQPICALMQIAHPYPQVWIS
jgi:hypothetical protein